MKLAKPVRNFNIVILLTRRAWDCIEDLTAEQLARPQPMIRSLGGWTADFEAFFVRLQTKPGQTVQEYQAEFASR